MRHITGATAVLLTLLFVACTNANNDTQAWHGSPGDTGRTAAQATTGGGQHQLPASPGEQSGTSSGARAGQGNAPESGTNTNQNQNPYEQKQNQGRTR